MVKERFVLVEDVPDIVGQAVALYDWAKSNCKWMR
jgi:hypothetical protein